jgi:hypothetical protein
MNNVKVEVSNLHSPFKKGNKINSLNEVESDDFAEDEDETGSMTNESPEIKNKKADLSNHSNSFLGKDLNKKKHRVFSTEMNSNSQNDNSHHQFKLSISSVDE